LALVIAAHGAVVGFALTRRPVVDQPTPRPPIFADVLIAERPDPTPVPEPTPPQPEQVPDTTPPPDLQRSVPAPRLAVAETAPLEEPVTVAHPEIPAVEPGPIAETAPTATEPARESAAALAGDPDEVRNYIAAVMRQLQRHKTYPRPLKKAKVEGTVLVEFTIDRHGRLVASTVKRGSGHPDLDRAALDMLARADPLPGIPDFMQRNELALAIPVEYSLITDR
jgi:protein TonB